MDEKFYATAMIKIPLDNQETVYKVGDVIAGNIDESTHILTTAQGEEYVPITDFTVESPNGHYYYHQISQKKFEKLFGKEKSDVEALEDYENDCKKMVYIVSCQGEGDYILMPIDKSPYYDFFEQIKNEEESSTEETDQLYDENDVVEENPIITGLKNLVAQITDGKYDFDELTDIKIQLTDQQEEVEAAIETVDMELEKLERDLNESQGIEEDSSAASNLPQSDIQIDDVFDKVTEVLIAQDEPAKRVITEIARLNDMRKKDYAILLTGETGVGKTLLMSLIARHIGKPFLAIDSTQLTAPGYIGKNIEEYLWELYEKCGGDKAKAESAIIYFDEIDKKGSERKSDVAGQAVLMTLLKFLDGTTYTASKYAQHQLKQESVSIKTDNMIIVCGGAFLDVYGVKNNNAIGFGKQEEKTISGEPTIDDFVKKAMIPKEFMGRVPVIVRLNNLDIDSLRRILLEGKDSALRLQEEVFDKRGVKLTTKDGYITAVAQKALDRQVGARGLSKIITDTTWEAYYDVRSNPDAYEEVILTEQTVENPKQYQLVKRKQAPTSPEQSSEA